MSACGHPLCALVGGDCSLASGVSRGCRTGPRVAEPFEAELVDEVAELLAQLPERTAAARLAFLFRREARRDRNLLGLATDELLEPELADRLVALCRRGGSAWDNGA